MALEDFTSDSSQEDEDTKWVSEDGIDWTCCSCDISEVHRFEEPVDELDLVAHMRSEHGLEFEEAKKIVTKEQEIQNERNSSGTNPLFIEGMKKFHDATAGNAKRVNEMLSHKEKTSKSEDYKDWDEFYE